VGREDMPYPTVGLSFGMESIMALLAERPNQVNKTANVMVIPIGETLPQALIAVAELRACSIRTTLITGKRKLKKQLATASAKNIRYVILIGESESSVDKVCLKDMEEQTEVIVPLDEAIYLITG
jgi:histidyl-tRNA synthetase